MRFSFTSALAVALLSSTVFASAAEPVISGMDPKYVNRSASPCKDFYTYANGAFDKVPIPGEYAAYGVNQELDERNFAVLKNILETSAKAPGSRGSMSQRVGDFYAAGMNEAAIEKAGLAPLKPWFDQIDAVKSVKDLASLIGRFQVAGLDAGFSFGVQIDDKDSNAMIASFAQGGLGLPNRDDYFRDDAASKDIFQDYHRHVGRMLELAGDKPDVAKAHADLIVALETKLAKASRTIVELRDPEKNYNKYERTTLNKLTTVLPWETFFTEIQFPSAEKTVLVGQPEFFTALGGLLESEPLATWRIYLRWHLLRQTAAYLSKNFADERFAFYGKKLSGTTEQRPRWKRVMAAADQAIGEDLGQLFVQRTFSPEAKAKALEMVAYHLKAMRMRIQAADWMTAGTKEEAYKKIDLMRTKVGYPDKWRDYSALTITRDSYVKNVLAGAAFEMHRQLNKLGKPVDRTEWLMTPQTNNAYYEPTLNEMCFPAGILQPPFFDVKADEASNYGALASTVGHELTHGFDDQGRQYDAHGNLKSWWTDSDAKAFEGRAESIANQYESYEVLPGLHLNGHQTLGENIADVGGLRIAYEAYKLATANKKLTTIDGFTPDQRFFISFAQGWRTNDRPEHIRLTATNDVHSPARWRVIGPVANFPEFRSAFKCEEPVKGGPVIW